MAPPPLVFARGLRKQFGDLVAVDGIDFDVARGQAFGFLGPNGAGKTSTMRMIACLSPRTGGELSVLGMDPDREGSAIRARLGLVPQLDSLDLELTVLDNLVLYGRYFSLPTREARRRAEELLEFVQLADRAKAEVDSLSGGMKRRLVIARGLINEPELLMLDEPTTGLDPQARHLVWDRLFHLKERGTTLLLTTHYMDEAEQLCDRLVVMDHARIVAEGTPQELIRDYSSREVVELRLGGELDGHVDHELEHALAGIAPRVERLTGRALLYVDDGDRALAQVHERGIEPSTAVVRRGSLEDVFLRLTGRSLIE
ncbi:MAG: ATP-binding cassette domain-containing protein [Candidatus Dormibacteraeota bacterium]|nr:ATP-binding cassette domain-containing protein [Candidatus Dormibacteraeota bacterium]